MAKDVIITPASGKLDFYGTAGGSVLANINLTDNNDLSLSTTSGNLIIGDASRDVYIGDGTNEVDIVFEQNGEIRSVAGKYITVNAGTVNATGVAVNTTSPTAVMHVYGSTPSGTVLNVEGTNGSLFSVVDNLDGTLMSVNNNAGLPVLEVFSDDRIVGGRFGQNDFVVSSSGNLGVGTANPAYKLEVAGHTAVSGTLYIVDSAYGTYKTIACNGNNISFAGNHVLAQFSVGLGLNRGSVLGMSAPSATSLGLYANSIQGILIDAAGSVGIGTSSPSTKLEVNGTVTATTLVKSGGTSSQFLKADGSVDSSTYVTSLSHNHGIADSAGTQQFTFGINDNIRIAGGGATSIAFDSNTKKITISSTDTNTTYSASNGVTLTGTTFSHTDTSSQSNTNNSGRTYIQNLSFDTYGHVTGVATATETVVDTNTYLSSASFNTSNGVLTLTKNDSTTVTVDLDGKYAESSHSHVSNDITDFCSSVSGCIDISTELAADSGVSLVYDSNLDKVTLIHTDTSSQDSVDNSNGTVIQDVTLDTYGHVTALGSVNLDSRYYTESEVDTLLSSKLDTSLKGTNNGLAELDSTGKVPSAQLPSYVDDVLEYADLASFPTSGEESKIYIAWDTNKTYRWSGTGYIEISASLALGESGSTAYRGDRGKTAYDHSQVTTGAIHGSSTVGTALFRISNNSTSIKFIRVNADNTLTYRTGSEVLSDIGAYAATNPNGYTTNTGTVTSVGGTGTVAGLTLTGTVTTTGSLTLDGTLSTPVSSINDSTTVGQNLVKLTNPSAVRFLRINANNTVDALTDSQFRTAIGAGTSSTTGTVTSVGLSLPDIFNVSGSPISSNGTLSAGFVTQASNTVFAGPSSGNGTPSFRALVAADIPTLNQNTTGTSAGVNTTVAVGSYANLVYATIGTNDYFRIRAGGAADAGDVEIATADNGNEPIYVRQYSGVFATLTRTATLLDSSGNTTFPGSVTAGSFVKTLSAGEFSTDLLQAGGGVISPGSLTVTYAGTAGTANQVANTLTIGSYLTGNNFNGSAATTWAVDATSSNTASKVVARDASGNFSAGTITANQVNVDNLRLDGNTISSTNGNLIVSPNGSGALQSDVNGDPRGSFAVDLQRCRSNTDQISSGNYSTISGGRDNKAVAGSSTVSGGCANTVSGYGSVASGGGINTASADYSVISGGRANTASGCYSTISGGYLNTASSSYAFVGGGNNNCVIGCCSNIVGGYLNTVLSNTSNIVGGQNNIINSPLSSILGGSSNNIAQRIVSANNITSSTNTLTLSNTTASLFNNTTNNGMLISYNIGSNVYQTYRTVSTSTQSGDNVTLVLTTNIGQAGLSYTNVKVLNVATSETISRSAIVSGRGNTMSASYSAILSGVNNKISGQSGFIGGGAGNNICGSIYATIVGGLGNVACGNSAVVVGGYFNSALKACSVVAGGNANVSSAEFSYIGGGQLNSTCSGSYWSVIGGGSSNIICGNCGWGSVIGGGIRNCLSGKYSTISGGYCNFTNARHSNINGGHRNVIQSPTNECCSRGATIGGGVGHNSSGGTVNATTGDISGAITCCNAGRFSTISGGLRNIATGACSTVGGGFANTASGYYSTISGGYCNISYHYSTVGGGSINDASGYNSTVGGGNSNTASGYYSTVSGGYGNTAGETGATVGGGTCNSACGSCSTVSGGFSNTASGYHSTVSGGRLNTVSGNYSTIGGGRSNTVSSTCSFVFGSCNCSMCDSSSIIGNNITTDRSCTLFVNNLSIKNIPSCACGLPAGSVFSCAGVLRIV